MAAAPLPVHVPLANEVDAHIVEKIANDGTLMLRDQTNGSLRPIRIGVVEAAGELRFIVIGDP